ncbi:hypothetical protein PR048_006641 [Dryococelus australis]|uniref:PiggyBac transposable element-derived protein domain-containing protein n=1 Tax=Dryococelus australis TaxID=614101 RepID=A0ABQ9IBL2_9NEOP|nr:hypothetical protein PR048_006641 [Dryococelus australis]
MVPYFGKHGCKQFIRGKPIFYGYKLWTEAAKTSYIVWMDLYQASVVLQYVDVLRTMGQFNFHSDNFFTSIPLLSELCKRNIRGTDTITENRLGNCSLTH